MTNTHSDKNVITIEAPRGGMMSGFDAIFRVLFLFAGWMLVVIGYVCVPGSLVAAAVGAYVGITNVGAGLGAALLGFGCAVACLGLCLPALKVAGWGRGMALRATKALAGGAPDELPGAVSARFPGKKVLTVCAVLVVAGAAAAGLGALLGGGEAVVLPDFLNAVFSASAPEVQAPASAGAVAGAAQAA